MPSALGVEEGDVAEGADPGPGQPPDAGRAGRRGGSRASSPGELRRRSAKDRSGRLELARWLVDAGPPADRAGDGQPDLALALRPGAGGHPRQFRHDRRPAGPPRTAGLARAPLHRGGLVDQGDAPAHHALEHLPDEGGPRPEGHAGRPGEPAPLAMAAPAARGRGDPRLPPGRRRDPRPGRGGPSCTSRTASTSSTTRRSTRPGTTPGAGPSTCRSSATTCTTSSSSSTSPTRP